MSGSLPRNAHASNLRQNRKHCKSSIANKINAITLHNEHVLDGLLVGAFNKSLQI